MIIVCELNHTNAKWERRKKAVKKLPSLEQKEYLRQHIDEWEVAELIKALLRYLGVEEAKLLLGMPAF